MPVPQDVIEKLKSEHGEVWLIETESHSIVIRCPKDFEFDDFQTSAAEPKKRPAALRLLARKVVLYPSAEEFQQILQRRPGLASKVANEACNVALDERTDDAKKA